MSAQSGLEIPFSVSHSHAPLRLLELPSELLEVLNSSATTTLSLKSTSSESGSSEAALCTSNKTYQLRQVQTSNSLYVVAPSTTAVNDSNDQPGSGVTTFAQCNWTLEVSKAPSQSALPYLRQALPLYTGLDDSDLLETIEAKTKAAIFSDIPLSDGECEQAWTKLIAFEIRERKSAYRPTAKILTKTWSSVSLSAIGKSIDLSTGLKVTELEDLVDSLDEIPSELAVAMIKRLVASDQQALLSDMPLSEIEPSATFTLDRTKTVRLVGTWLLESLGETTQVELIRQWQNLLSETWREDAQLSAIEGGYTSSAGGKVTSVSSVQQEGSSKSTTAPATTAAKRKWHEKFAQTRKR